MQETLQEYIQRILAYWGARIRESAVGHADETERLIKGGRPQNCASDPPPENGRSEKFWRISRIAKSSPAGGCARFWARPEHRFRRSTRTPGRRRAITRSATRKSLEQFRALRDANLALLKSLSPEQWKQHGMHAERGVETIEHISA